MTFRARRDSDNLTSNKLRYHIKARAIPCYRKDASDWLCINKATKYDQSSLRYISLEVNGVKLESGTAVATLLMMGIV